MSREQPPPSMTDGSGSIMTGTVQLKTTTTPNNVNNTTQILKSDSLNKNAKPENGTMNSDGSGARSNVPKPSSFSDVHQHRHHHRRNGSVTSLDVRQLEQLRLGIPTGAMPMQSPGWTFPSSYYPMNRTAYPPFNYGQCYPSPPQFSPTLNLMGPMISRPMPSTQTGYWLRNHLPAMLCYLESNPDVDQALGLIAHRIGDSLVQSYFGAAYSPPNYAYYSQAYGPYYNSGPFTANCGNNATFPHQPTNMTGPDNGKTCTAKEVQMNCFEKCQDRTSNRSTQQQQHRNICNQMKRCPKTGQQCSTPSCGVKCCKMSEECNTKNLISNSTNMVAGTSNLTKSQEPIEKCAKFIPKESSTRNSTKRSMPSLISSPGVGSTASNVQTKKA